MKKITILFITFLFGYITQAQVGPAIPVSSGSGSHELEITSSDSDFIVCPSDCVDLTADYLEVGNTDSYAVNSIPFNPPFNFNGLTNLIFLNTDDLWTPIINLPFDFCFFGDSYNEIIIGSNGVLSFEVANANTGNGWAFTQSLPNNTNPTLSEANIFGAGHDIDPAASNGTHEIGWEVKGVAPFRALVVSFFNVANFACNELKNFQMMVLYESTNTIEVYILDKPTCFTWNNGNAVIGIQNIPGTVAYTPPGRNTGNWSASVEAWQFLPNGGVNDDVFSWYDSSGTFISNNQTISVCPTADETYTAEIVYNPDCGYPPAIATRDVTITVDNVPAVPTFTMTPDCDGGTATITGDGGGTFSFNPVPGDGATIDPATGTVINGVPGTSYTIEYEVINDCGDPFASTESVTVLTVADASFTMTATCDGGTATITGDAGGTFGFNPAPGDAAVIDAATGTVTGGTPGTTYTIEYTISGTCGDSTTESVTALTAADPSFTLTATCDGGTATITGDVGGTFAFNPVPGDGAIVDVITGTITNGVPGTSYTLEYTISGTCGDSSTESVTVLSSADASFTMTATCDGGTAIITGDAGGTFGFNPAPGDAAVIDAATGAVTGGTPGATYTIEYTIAGACGDSSIESVTALTAVDVTFTTTATCDGGTVTITGDTGGTFTFNPDPGDGASINPVTGEVTGGTSGTTYTINYEIAGACGDDSDQTVTVLTAVDVTFTTTATCDGGTVTITGDAGGTFTFNPDPGDGASINPVTGEVTGGTSGTTYTINYEIAGACGDDSDQTVTVLTAVDVTFTTTATCDGGTVTITGDAGGTFTFNPDPGDGASINPVTGEVTGGTSGTTYTINYEIAGACGDDSDQTVTALTAVDVTFTTTATCDGGTVTITGDTGGTFTFNPDPGDGASINPVTGEVTGGTSGTTYTINYEIVGACGDDSNQTVTALTAADVTFTTTATCDGGTVTITGDAGGTFTFNPDPGDGASINPVTGEVTGGTSGATYTINYEIAGTCGDDSDQTVTVLAAEDASFTMTATCDGGTATITGDAGGMFAFNPIPGDGASIAAGTGTVTGGTAGTTYTVEYTTVGACPGTSTQNVTVLPAEDASFTMTPTCDGGTATITGDAGGIFAFNPIPGDGASIAAGTGTVTGGTAGTTYTVEYTTVGACPASSTQNVTVLTTADPSFTMTATCDGGTATITGDAGGTFTFSPDPGDGASINPVTGEVTGGTSGATYTINYEIAGACGDDSDQTVTVLAAEDASFTMTATCDGGTATITGDAGGMFTFDPIPGDGASIDTGTGTVTGGVAGTTYTVEYTTVGTCPASSTQNVTVLPAEDASFTMTPTCDGGTATITGDAGGMFAFNPTPGDGASIDAGTGTVSGGIAGTTYTVEYTTVGTCPASSTQNVTVLTTADASFTMTPTCDGGIATITGDTGGMFTFNPVPSDGASIVAGTGEVTGGASGTTYTVEYTIGGSCGNSSTQTVTVNSRPTIINPDPLIVCDDTILDGITELDLTVKNDEITASNPDYVVTYHTSLIDAQNGMPEVAPSDTEYIGTDGEIVFVRVEDSATGCFDTTTLVLNVVNGPPVNAPLPLYDCDLDNDNLGSFDLSSVRDDILAIDPTLIVSFHLTLSNAQDDVNPQGDLLSNVAGQIIYVRVEFGSGIDCATIVEVELIVEPAPDVPSDIDPYVICDDDLDGTATFDLTTMDATIYGSQLETDFILTYHESLANAEAIPAIDPIIEPQLSNYVSGNTTIYVRLEGLNGCIKVGQFDLIVNPLPVIPAEAQDSIYEICDDSDDNDGYATFDLTTQNDVLTGGDVTLEVNYFETISNIPDNPISNDTAYTNVSIGGLPHNPQTIFVSVTETTSGSNCYSVTSLTLVVNTLPTPSDVLPDLVRCDDNNPGDLQEEFDLTEHEDLMLNDFDETVTYHESLVDAELGENPITNETTYTNIASPQTIFVLVTNTGNPADSADEGTGCYAIITFDLIVDPVPMFTPDDFYTICVDTNGTEVAGLPTIDTGLSAASFTFEWVNPDGVIVGVDSSYTATQAGDFTVEITDIGSTCSNIIPVLVLESSPPLVDAVVVSGAFADENIIEVTASGSGAASFEFSLDNGPWLSNDPSTNTYTFTDVTLGEHVIRVRDIYGCGIGMDTVLVMDYPLFFTPNNDGLNDTWQVAGLSNQLDAKIYIFDRYGKLLKQLSPSSNGWDGTFNGQPLPSSDYWFSLEYREPNDLTDTTRKEFRAHFTLKR